MRLVLVRHGNTFGPGDEVVWVGARTDLPLVPTGLRQAEAVAAGLRAAGLVPDRIYAGPLRRTAETAAVIARDCGLAPHAVTTSAALREIDYGAWEGRSNAAIRAEAGDAAIDGWQRRSIWPEGMGWSPDETAILAAWADLLATLRRDMPATATVAIVSSNGIFRLVAKAVGIAPAEAKMATGAVSHLVERDGGLDVIAWNIDPSRLAD
jgi:probable phosphoglycerate mutase